MKATNLSRANTVRSIALDVLDLFVTSGSVQQALTVGMAPMAAVAAQGINVSTIFAVFAPMTAPTIALGGPDVSAASVAAAAAFFASISVNPLAKRALVNSSFDSTSASTVISVLVAAIRAAASAALLITPGAANAATGTNVNIPAYRAWQDGLLALSAPLNSAALIGANVLALPPRATLEAAAAMLGALDSDSLREGIAAVSALESARARAIIALAQEQGRLNARSAGSAADASAPAMRILLRAGLTPSVMSSLGRLADPTAPAKLSADLTRLRHAAALLVSSLAAAGNCSCAEALTAGAGGSAALLNFTASGDAFFVAAAASASGPGRLPLELTSPRAGPSVGAAFAPVNIRPTAGELGNGYVIHQADGHGFQVADRLALLFAGEAWLLYTDGLWFQLSDGHMLVSSNGHRLPNYAYRY